MTTPFTGGKYFDIRAVGLAPGGRLYTYAAGTLTPQATYTDQGGLSPNTNPVLLSQYGQANVWLGANSFRFRLYSDLIENGGTLIDDIDNIISASASLSDSTSPSAGSGSISFNYALNYVAGTLGAWLKGLAAAAGSTFIGWAGSLAGAITRTLSSRLRDTVYVTDYGADPTGAVDSTAAFNLACQATAAWSSALEYNIEVPPGHYKLNGSVYIRKGQTLGGTGHGVFLDLTGNTTVPTFFLGSGLIAGVQAADPGGSPVKIHDMWTSGGAGAAAVIKPTAAGFAIANMFMTFPGVGIDCTGVADGIITNTEIDQCLTGVTLSGSQNIVFSNFNIYLPRYAISFGSDNRDIIFSDGIIEYPQYTAALFQVGTGNCANIQFNSVTFTMNTQYGTFVGYIQSAASNIDVSYNGCNFRNWPGYVLNQTAGVGTQHVFTGCIFDALKTAAVYDQSTTAKVINTGVGGSYSLYDCEYRNLLGEIVTVNASMTQLLMLGGNVVNCDATSASRIRFGLIATTPQNITVKGVANFPYVFTSGSNQCAYLPYWGGQTLWKLAIKGNTQAGGDGNYIAMEEAVYAVSWQNNAGTKSIYVDKILLWKTPTRTNPGDLAAVACFGGTPGGAASSTTFAAVGSILVSVPFTAQSNFDFYAETAL